MDNTVFPDDLLLFLTEKWIRDLISNTNNKTKIKNLDNSDFNNIIYNNTINRDNLLNFINNRNIDEENIVKLVKLVAPIIKYHLRNNEQNIYLLNTEKNNQIPLKRFNSRNTI